MGSPQLNYLGQAVDAAPTARARGVIRHVAVTLVLVAPVRLVARTWTARGLARHRVLRDGRVLQVARRHVRRRGRQHG